MADAAAADGVEAARGFPGEPLRLVFEREAETGRVAASPQDARGVVDEAALVQDADETRVEVGAPAVGIDHVAEALRVEGGRHRVDGEVAPREVGVEVGRAHRGQRPGASVPLLSRRGEVDTDRPHRHRRGEKAVVRLDRPAARGGETARRLPRVAFHHHVEVEPAGAEQEVADDAADEEGALAARRRALRRGEQQVPPLLGEALLDSSGDVVDGCVGGHKAGGTLQTSGAIIGPRPADHGGYNDVCPALLKRCWSADSESNSRTGRSSSSR